MPFLCSHVLYFVVGVRYKTCAFRGRREARDFLGTMRLGQAGSWEENMVVLAIWGTSVWGWVISPRRGTKGNFSTEVQGQACIHTEGGFAGSSAGSCIWNGFYCLSLLNCETALMSIVWLESDEHIPWFCSLNYAKSHKESSVKTLVLRGGQGLGFEHRKTL